MQPHPLHALAHMRDSFGITPFSNGEDNDSRCLRRQYCLQERVWTYYVDSRAKKRLRTAPLHFYGSRILLFDLPCDVIAQGLLRQPVANAK